MVHSLVNKHNYMNNEPYGSDINHHFPHTEELARGCLENILFSGCGLYLVLLYFV